MKMTLKERLYAKLPDRTEGQCWLFAGARNRNGYGNIYTRMEGRRVIYAGAHRASYEVHVGPIPNGQFVLHRCDNKLCCNPAHLFLGTQADNMQDKSRKGRALPGPCADPAWWTEERRAERAIFTGQRERRKRERKQRLAGVSTDTKFCPTCRRWLQHDEFGNNRARSDGLQPHCKPCKNAAESVRVRRKMGRTHMPRRATRSDKICFVHKPT